MQNKKSNLWPLFLSLFLIFMMIMIITTVYISMKYKHDEDGSYFSTRQEVDANINNKLIEQKILESEYKFYTINNGDKIPLQRDAKQNPPIIIKDKLDIKILMQDSNQNNIKADRLRAYLGRFATSKDDIYFDMNYENGFYQALNLDIEKGYWKLLIEVSKDEKKAYFELSYLKE